MAARDELGSALESVQFANGVRDGFWQLIRRDSDLLHIEVFAWDGTGYVIELQCDSYGAEPIRGRFVDPCTFACTAEAWPQGDGTFNGWFKWKPGELFICWPGDRGGVEHHTDWRSLQHWRKKTNQLVQYLEFLRQCLTLPARGYQPRPHLCVS